jgi:type I restriction enzyme S subunit
MDTKALRQKILDLAIRGKLVPQDPNDEPASVLLERIRAEKEKLVKEGKIKGTKKVNTSDTPHYENMPFELPKGWVWCDITDIISKLVDGTHHSPKNFPMGDFMYVTAKNIKTNGICLDNITYIDSETHNEIYSRCNPEKGDILYIKDGATTGIVTINNLDQPFSLLSSVALIKPVKTVSNEFLCYFLQSSLCYNFVRQSMKGVGITRVTLQMISSWQVPLPPFAEQVRIVYEIKRWFHLIDYVEKKQMELHVLIDQTKLKTLELAIQGKLIFQNKSDEPAIELLHRINPRLHTFRYIPL